MRRILSKFLVPSLFTKVGPLTGEGIDPGSAVPLPTDINSTYVALQPLKEPSRIPGSRDAATLPQGPRAPRDPGSRTPSSPYLGRRARSRRAGGRAAGDKRGSSRKPARPALGP